MNSLGRDVLLVEHPVIDEYAEAYRRGDGGDPESWLRDRTPENLAGVATLRTLGLLIRHKDAINLHQPTTMPDDSDDDPTPTVNPFLSSPRGPVMSDPSIRLDDRAAYFAAFSDWLRSHQLELLWALDGDVGGMGEVFLAWHQVMKCELIVKIPRDSRNEERFRREIELHTKLRGHSQIAIARMSMLYWGVPVLVIDYVPGPSLRRHLKRVGRLPCREASQCIRQAALGLGHAHALGIVHRDVKPGNLVRSVRDGLVYVIDWGLARDRESPPDRDETLTQPGCPLGTPLYCAPEQAADSSSATASSDLYGLGCTWYELITGEPPFRGNPSELRAAHARSPIPRLDPAFDVPESVEEVLMRLLHKDPERRYSSASEFVLALEASLPESELTARELPHFKPWLVAAVLILAVTCWSFFPSSVRPKAIDLVIELSDVSPKPERSGQIGISAFGATVGDQAIVRAKLSWSAYAYLISFRPDGQMELCEPKQDSDRPGSTPNPSTELAVDLNDGTGLQAFAAVVSSAPLPEFQKWRSDQGPPPWRPTPADPGLVWNYDGEQTETRSPGATVRGAGASPRGAWGAVDRLGKWLKSRPGVDSVAIKAFAVSPARP